MTQIKVFAEPLAPKNCPPWAFYPTSVPFITDVWPSRASASKSVSVSPTLPAPPRSTGATVTLGTSSHLYGTWQCQSQAKQMLANHCFFRLLLWQQYKTLRQVWEKLCGAEAGMSHPGLGVGQMHGGKLASIFPLQSNSK